MSHSNPPNRAAITIIELLIVLTIIALLVQLALPAVQRSREAARRAQCLSNLRQIALGFQGHLASAQHFPTGGWNWQWVGDPRRGSDSKQPGGWIYNLLPYIEEQEIFDHSDVVDDDERLVRGAEMQAMAINLLHCPSRRPARAYRNHWRLELLNSNISDTHARTDYAANGGDFYTNLGPSPNGYEEADSPNYQWADYPDQSTGITYTRSTIRAAEITDGLSKTYLVGEKYLAAPNYENGIEDGDDSSIYQGDDMDIVRWTTPTISDHAKHFTDRPNTPRQDDSEFVTAYAFGSAHAAGWHVAMCDGSVRLSSYDLDPKIHQTLGNRKDGDIVSEVED